MKKDEKDFSKTFVDCLKRQTWVERIEPSRGMQSGIPDIYCLVDFGTECFGVFIELKVGTVKDGVLFPREIRPAQFSWHKRYTAAGGISFVCIGVGSNKNWQAYYFDIDDCTDWKRGIDINKAFLVDDVNDMSYMVLNSVLNRRRGV